MSLAASASRARSLVDPVNRLKASWTPGQSISPRSSCAWSPD
jgi:hypothetical protein